MKNETRIYRPYIRLLSVLPFLLFIFLTNNSAAFSQTTDSSNNFLQMPSNLTSRENSNSVSKTNGSQATSIVKLLSINLENYFQNAGALLNITSQLPQVRNVSFAHLLNQTLATLHGIPQDADIEKRQIAQNILSEFDKYQIIIFIMPNGDIYFDEPYSRQQISTTTNLGFRDYFEGVIRTNNIYLGDPSTSASSGQIQAVIAVPVYSLEEDNSTLVGVWAGGLDFSVLNEELQSLNLTSLEGNARVAYVGNNGQKIADSDKSRASQVESFATLNSFKNAISGQSGTVIDTVDDKPMLVTYHPVKAFQNTYVVLLMQAKNNTTASN